MRKQGLRRVWMFQVEAKPARLGEPGALIEVSRSKLRGYSILPG
jgi:hypothetical protein